MKYVLTACAFAMAAPYAVAQTTSYNTIDTIFTHGTATLNSSGLCKVANQKYTNAKLVRIKESPSNREFLSIVSADNSIIAFFDLSQSEHLTREFSSQASGTAKKANAKGVQTEHLILAAETLKLLHQRNESCFPQGRSNAYLFTDGEPNSTLTIQAKYVNDLNTGGTAKQVIKAQATHFDYTAPVFKYSKTSSKETDKKEKTIIKVSFSASAPYIE